MDSHRNGDASFLDGNKHIAFAAAHTFLLINGFDLAVDSTSAFEFIMRSLSTS
jgi:prophage maintenance system killer protein